ncbi:MAG: caspase family protein, partial [Bacteroidales bacterium]|nr:caspase family protein [Bacteroidales bacterium]
LEHQDISIPIKGRKNILNGKAVYSVYIREPGGIESDHQTLEIVTRKYELPVLRISRAEFYGLDGKEIQLNEPFELALEIENRGTGTAFHVDVEPKVTNENIRIESNKRHTIPEIPGGQSRKVTFQFQANKHYIFPGVYIRIEITEGFNDLFQDEMVATSIQIPEEKKPPVNEPAQAITEEIPKKGSEEAKPAVVKVIPDLELLSHEFIDEDKNHIINYKESCEIKFRIKNSGSGVAEGVTVITKQLNMAISRLSFEDSITLGNLGPNQEVPVSIPIRSTGMMPTDLADFRIEVVEANGWDAVPLSFTVKTEKLLEPSLAIVNAEFLGESGKIERNEDIELRVTLRNSGEGDASDVNVQFQLPNNSTCFLVGDAIDEYNVKKLRRGESRDFSLFFITNRRYTDNEIPVKVDISESLRKHGIDTVLVGNMNEEVQAIMKHEVQPRIIDQPARTEPPIVVQQEAVTEPPSGTEILTETQVTTTRGGGDPLKSLGYEEAMNEIGIEIGKYIALIIGIDDYQGGWQPLKNAVHDAKAVENMLETKYKFDYVIPLYNGMATEEQIILQLNWLTEHVTPDDNVLIFYSGHGEFNDRLNRGYWVPVDAQANSPHSYISNSDIQDYLAAINSKHTLLISDACFSGDIFRGETISIPKVKTERYFREVHSKPSRQAITSGGIEPVMDGGKGNHSVFTYYLLQSLEKNDEIFFDASQLYSELKIPVVNNSSQYPDFQHIEDTGDEGGQFIFIKK